MAENKRRALLRQVLDRIKALEQVRADIDLAEPLATNKRNVAAWKERGTLPWERLYHYCENNQISLEWLLNGRGATHVQQLVEEPSTSYRVPSDLGAVYRISGDLYRALRQSQRQIDPEQFSQLVELLHRDLLKPGEERVGFAQIVRMLDLFGNRNPS